MLSIRPGSSPSSFLVSLYTPLPVDHEKRFAFPLSNGDLPDPRITIVLLFSVPASSVCSICSGDLATGLDAGCRRPGLGSFRQGRLHTGGRPNAPAPAESASAPLSTRRWPYILRTASSCSRTAASCAADSLRAEGEFLLCLVEFGLCLFPLLARHIFADSLQSGTGSLHPFLCGFEPGFPQPGSPAPATIRQPAPRPVASS